MNIFSVKFRMLNNNEINLFLISRTHPSKENENSLKFFFVYKCSKKGENTITMFKKQQEDPFCNNSIL